MATMAEACYGTTIAQTEKGKTWTLTFPLSLKGSAGDYNYLNVYRPSSELGSHLQVTHFYPIF